MFPQSTLPKRLYLYAGLSLLALGYCTGRSCSNEPQQQQPQQTKPSEQPTAPLEQLITPDPVSPSIPEIQQPAAQQPREKQLTVEQRLLRYLRNPVHNPGDPQQSDVPFERPNIILGTNDSLWDKCRIYTQEKFNHIKNEARFVYKEAKDYLKDKCKEAIK